MPVARNPRKKVEKKADKADKVDKVKSSKHEEGKTKDNNRKRKASSPAVEILTTISHPSHGKVCPRGAFPREV